MIEVAPRLFVGNEIDGRKIIGKSGWSIVHACKEPFHREAVGYSGRALDRDHLEYFMAYRDPINPDPDALWAGSAHRRLCLNMIDAPKPEFFRESMIDRALIYIHNRIELGDQVLVHCNQGGSRAPSLALLYLRKYTDTFEGMSFTEAEDVFRVSYPLYQPASGIRAYVEQHWDDAPAATP